MDQKNLLPSYPKISHKSISLITPARLLSVYIIVLFLFIALNFAIGKVSLYSILQIVILLTGFLLISVGLSFFEIKSPNVGILYRFGRVQGCFHPGWYLILRPLEELEELSMVPIIVEDRSTRLSGSLSRVEIAWQAHLSVDLSKLPEYIRSRGVSMSLIWSTVWSAITNSVGQIRVEDWQNQTAFFKLEQASEQFIRQKLAAHGLKLESLAIVDAADQLAEKVQGIRVCGRAEAEAYGNIALATRATRGDLSHALAFIGASFAQVFRRAFGVKDSQ